MSEKPPRGRKAANSAEKGNSVYDAIKNPNVSVSTPTGTAFTEEMKKDLFKQLGLVKSA